MSERRPGIEAIIKEIRKKNPSWNEYQINNAAKEEWVRRHQEEKRSKK